MKANPIFENKSVEFWSYVKFLSEQLGYSERKQDRIKTYEYQDAFNAFDKFKTRYDVEILKDSIDYMNYRSNILNLIVKDHLMTVSEASELFSLYKSIHEDHAYSCTLPMNKQKGEKRSYSFYTCLVNIIAEQTLREICKNNNLVYGKDVTFNDNPYGLCFVRDDNNKLFFTFSRRFDGIYPGVGNVKLVWEVKEYYYTTTFGSRVADGIYETLLDGYEIREVNQTFQKLQSTRRIKHLFFVDDKFTWWGLGKSYLCRIIDILHQGFVSDVVFGKEILDVWPKLIKDYF